MTSESTPSPLQSLLQKAETLARETPNPSNESLTRLISCTIPSLTADEAAPDTSRRTIDAISIQGIRSFGPSQSLQLSEGLTVVYAKNGTGKTSVVDGLELATNGETSRRESTRGPAPEVKDPDNLPHRNKFGQLDDTTTPRVTVEYVNPQLSTSEWNGTWGAPATPDPPNLQLLPRRRLRELVNAGRAERIEHIGGALGLKTSIDAWNEIARELHARSTELQNRELPPYLKVLDSAICANISTGDIAIEASKWAASQQLNYSQIEDPPNADEWQQLRTRLESLWNSTPSRKSLARDQRTLLESFKKVAVPDAKCPACENGIVSEQRLGVVERLLNSVTLSVEWDRKLEAIQDLAEAQYHKLETWASSRSVSDKVLDGAFSNWVAQHRALRLILNETTRETLLSRVAEIDDCIRLLKDARTEALSATSDTAMDPTVASAIAAAQSAQPIGDQIYEHRHNRDRVAPILKRLAALVRDKMNTQISETVISLSHPINDWIRVLAPSSTEAISFSVIDSKNTRNRASIGINSVDDNGNPTSTVLGKYSDAQIDMVGLAAHLARIDHDHPNAALVIDDPSDMLDSSTRALLASAGLTRILEGHGSVPPRQVLILTHDDELVREIWRRQGGRSPALVQSAIEIDKGSQGDFATFVPRDARSAIDRAKRIISTAGSHERHQIWCRNAASVHTRQAFEMLAKEVDFMLGPAGAGLHQAPKDMAKFEPLGTITSRVNGTLQRIVAEYCDEPRYVHARRAIDSVRDLLSSPIPSELNPGAHADYVTPEMARCEEHLSAIESVQKLLTPPKRRPISDWVTDSKLARFATMHKACVPCSGRRHALESRLFRDLHIAMNAKKFDRIGFAID